MKTVFYLEGGGEGIYLYLYIYIYFYLYINILKTCVCHPPLCAGHARRLTCREVDAAPMSRPRDWATRAVDVDRAMKSRYLTASGGCSVIQYTMLQYMMGQST